jgi:hypothetical protein
MNIENMTKDEKSLLLFFETCCVDQSGMVDTRHMNAEDIEIAGLWTDREFVFFERITFKDL